MQVKSASQECTREVLSIQIKFDNKQQQQPQKFGHAVPASKSAKADSQRTQDSGQIRSIVPSRGESRTTPPETQDKHSSITSRHRFLHPRVFCKIDEPLNATRQSNKQRVPLVCLSRLFGETQKDFSV